MPNFAAAGTTQWRNFADRKRREVVVHHEPLVRFAFQPVQALRVVGGSKGCRHESLCFTASKNSRAVRTRQHAGFNPYRTNGFEIAFVRPRPFMQNLVAEDLLL